MAEVVVGIDFGTSGSGFAYAYNNNQKEIIYGNIFGANVDNKVPTQIILDDNDNTLKFGVECVEYIKKNGLKEGHFFKNIKMNLYKKKTIIQAQNSEKKLSLEFVIQRIMEKLKFLAIEKIKKNRPMIEKNNIKWVVTIPAIWEEFQKNVMMKACIKAGLIKEEDDKSLFFALEPEAASCYCLENQSIDQNLMKQGECYIICDLGGGTGDIVTHLIGVNKKLREISPPNGGQFGSNEINKLFYEDIIYKIFGCKDFNNYYKKYKEFHENNKNEEEEEEEEEEEGNENKEKKIEGILYNQWDEFERQINDFKEFTNINKIENLDKYPINFILFKDIFKKKTDLNTLVNNYNNNCDDINLKLKVTSKKKWIIEIPHKIIYNYIKKQVDSICKIINDILDSSDEEINKLIFVGGYCSNEILISEIKKILKNKIKYFLEPSMPCLSIMNGAVLFGLKPETINQRKARYTIGISIRKEWDESIHSKKGEKVYDEVDKIWRCKNCFSIFFRKNQDLALGQEITQNYVMLGQRYFDLKIYKTDKIEPIFVNEEGIEEMGKWKLDAQTDYPPKQRNFTVTMRVGGTFIDVKAKHIKSGNKINLKLEFN